MKDRSHRLPKTQPADNAVVQPVDSAACSETVSFKGDTDRGPMASSRLGDSHARRIGDFELIEPIAQGGMGVVYKARQVSMDRIVALKLIRAEELAADEEIERFCFEAQTAGQLNHPGIVSVYERGLPNRRGANFIESIPGPMSIPWAPCYTTP